MYSIFLAPSLTHSTPAVQSHVKRPRKETHCPEASDELLLSTGEVIYLEEPSGGVVILDDDEDESSESV